MSEPNTLPPEVIGLNAVLKSIQERFSQREKVSPDGGNPARVEAAKQTGQATRLNLYEEHAREKIGAQPEWRLFRWECFPHNGDTIYVEVIGAVCLEKFKSGKRKGYTNWRKLIPETRKIVVLPITEHDRWKKEWEERTARCAECTGTGEVFASWSVTGGTKYRRCVKCAGSGQGSGASAPAASKDSPEAKEKKPRALEDFEMTVTRNKEEIPVQVVIKSNGAVEAYACETKSGYENGESIPLSLEEENEALARYYGEDQ